MKLNNPGFTFDDVHGALLQQERGVLETARMIADDVLAGREVGSDLIASYRHQKAVLWALGEVQDALLAEQLKGQTS